MLFQGIGRFLATVGGSTGVEPPSGLQEDFNIAYLSTKSNTLARLVSVKLFPKQFSSIFHKPRILRFTVLAEHPRGFVVHVQRFAPAVPAFTPVGIGCPS